MTSRRQLLQTAAATGALTAAGDLLFLSRLPAVSAAEARVDPQLVALRPEIEPAVRLLEETPRERLLEEVAARIRRGMSYREVVAALLLAGVRNVQPRPSVGFKFHAVLVVNSAHLASLASPDSDRWLPIFWALDYFKSSQAQTEKESHWRMRAVDEARVPTAAQARQALTRAMDAWDEEAADAAVAGLARSAGPRAVFDLLWRYGARDFRSIGHKAIFVANSWRALQVIGQQHAEPVLRSLVYALLNREGDDPVKNDCPADRPWRRNQALAARIKAASTGPQPDAPATAEMLTTLRGGSDEQACDRVVELLNRGASPSSIWDALFAGAGELLMRQPGIIALHAVTSTNALHYAFETAGDDQTRRMLLLQNAAFLPLFRQAMDHPEERRIDHLEPLAPKAGGASAVEEIFGDISQDRMAAARKTLAYLSKSRDSQPLIDTARRLIFLKGNDAHDYKFSSAVLEDYYAVAPGLRDRYLAASCFILRGSGDADNKLVQRTRSALGS